MNSGANTSPGDAEGGVDDVGLYEHGAGESRPCPGEHVAEVLANGDAEVPVESLEGDVDGGQRLGSGGGVGGGPRRGKARRRASGSSRGPGRAPRVRRRSWPPTPGSGLASLMVAESSTTAGTSSRALAANPHHVATSRVPGLKPVEHLVGRPPKDVGIAEGRAQPGEQQVVGDREEDQQGSGDELGGHRRTNSPSAAGAGAEAVGTDSTAATVAVTGTDGASCSP